MSTLGKVTWGGDITTWLTQANTSVEQTYFQIFNITRYMYYVFLTIHIYIYYIQNNGGLQCCLGQVMSKEGFQASLKGFKL